MEEIWRDVKGFEGIYEISNLGRVKSLDMKRWTGHAYQFFPTKIRKIANIKGYCYIVLRKDGKSKNKAVHRLVAEAFIPNPENKAQVNHIDGNPLNNKLSNLEWVTPKENVYHSMYVLKNNHGRRKSKFNELTIKPK